MYGTLNENQNLTRFKIATNLGWTPADKLQQAFFLNPNSFKYFGTERRKGKSTLLVADALSYALYCRNSTQIIASCNSYMSEHMFEKIKGIVESELKDVHEIQYEGRKVMRINQSSICFITHNSSSLTYLRGRDIHRILCDDAENITTSWISEAIALMASTNGDLVMIGTESQYI